jgi:superfamily II DNA or RNA helicase
MLTNITYPPTLEYSSDGKYLPIEFFMTTIPVCKRIDLKLGYFSSNAIRTLSYGFAQFIHNGGVLRIVTNHYLSIKDKVLISEDNTDLAIKENEFEYIINNDLAGLAKVLENGDQHFFDCLKYLIKHDRLQIIPVKLKPNRLSHFKQGILDDGINQIYFNGSCNFTYKGLIDNGESLSIARSWGENSERIKVIEKNELIEKICNKKDDGFEYLNADQIITVIEKTGKDKQLDELIEEEIDIYQRLSSLPYLKKTFSTYTSSFKKRVDEEKNRPKFPYPEGPREYQRQAFENWRNNNQQGLFAMATGTGKTITSLNCLLEIYNRLGYYKALILVPTVTLVEQWEVECKRFNFQNIIKVCSKYRNWKNNVADIRMLELSRKDNNLSFIIISTYASFVRSSIFSELIKFPKNKILLIADEAHNMGSGQMIDRLNEIPYQRRIGLSATPERQFDDIGNQKLMNFFGCVDNYTFEYSMKEAIANGALCRYYYYPHVVRLTEIEMEQYSDISAKIVKIMGFKDAESQDILLRLLLKRKRIIHKAENKMAVFEDIIKNRMNEKGTLKYTLVYVPEGNKPDDNRADIFEKSDVIANDEDSLHLINEFTRTVRDTDSRIVVRQFTSESTDREPMLKDFATGKIDVLTSMKCLDEGIDVPRSELAIFCASTGNPRQFIQRRGRVLRTHKDKHVAIIHDLVVVPNICFDNDSFELERNLVAGELKRVRDFAMLSENLFDTDRELHDVLKHYNLSIFN